MSANENARRQPGVDTSKQTQHSANFLPIKFVLQQADEGRSLFAIEARARVSAMKRGQP